MADILQTHILPGFYNVFKAVPMSNYQQRGTLGVVALGMVMDWGKDDEPTELYSEDIITGASLRKIGYTIANTESILPYMLALISAPKAYLVKLNKNGNKAYATLGSFTIEAKYKGIFGNNINVVITANTPSAGKYTVTVSVSGARKESFVVSEPNDLLAIQSSFVVFKTESETPSMPTTTGIALTNGTNGSIVEEDTAGSYATKTIGSLVFTAKNVGANGNKIGITIAENTTDPSKYDLTVAVDGVIQETFAELKDVAGFVAVASNLVTITNPSGTTITTTTNELLEDGADAGLSSYSSYREELKYKQFNVCAIMVTSEKANKTIIDIVNKRIAASNKRLVEGIVFNKPMLNNDHIVSVEQGIECDQFTITTELNIPLVASMRAGCPLNESLTDYNLTELVGARKIINPINDDDDTELENAIAQGRFVYKYEEDGTVRVLQDINTLVNFTDDKPKGYRKNRHIAILDYLVNEERRMAHDGIIGKFSNVQEKRNIIAARYITIFKELYDMTAIKEYDPLTDLRVNMGADIEVVKIDQTVRPTDSIEILDCTTNVDFNFNEG